MPTKVIEGIYALDPGFAVRLECLGQAFPSQVTGVPVKVILPRCEEDGRDRRPLMSAPPWVHLLAEYDWQKHYPDEPTIWGSAYSWNRDEGCDGDGAAYVERVGISFETEDNDSTAQMQAQMLAEALGVWWPTIVDWIEVLTRQDLAPGYSTVEALHMPRLWTRDDAHRLTQLRLDQGPIVVRAQGIDVATTRAQLNSILKAAGEKISPPLEWLLIRDARAALRRKHWRRAVIDAGTASELTITRTIEALLSDVEPSIVGALLAGHRMLGRRADLLIELGGHLPSNFKDGLIEPRNAATHRGAAPTEDVAAEAVNLATEVTEAALPSGGLLRV